MQEQRACANGGDMPGLKQPPSRVSEYENHINGGLPRCGDSVYRDKIKKIDSLRQQDAEYFASLPSDPREARKKALNLLAEITDTDEMLDQTEALLMGIRGIARDAMDDSFYEMQAILTIVRVCEEQVSKSKANADLAHRLIRKLEV